MVLCAILWWIWSKHCERYRLGRSIVPKHFMPNNHTIVLFTQNPYFRSNSLCLIQPYFWFIYTCVWFWWARSQQCQRKWSGRIQECLLKPHPIVCRKFMGMCPWYSIQCVVDKRYRQAYIHWETGSWRLVCVLWHQSWHLHATNVAPLTSQWNRDLTSQMAQWGRDMALPNIGHARCAHAEILH